MAASYNDIIWPATPLSTFVWLLLVASFITALAFSSLFSSASTFITGNAFPGIPRLSGNPILGALPRLCSDGIPAVLWRLIKTAGDEGISYCWVGPTVLISLSDPVLVREALSQPDDILSREGNHELWTPLSTLRRLTGNSAFLYVGEKARVGRTQILQTFANARSLAENFNFIAKISKKHVDRIIKEGIAAKQHDVKRFADDYAVDMWGEFLYEMKDAHLDNDTLLPLMDDIAEITTDASHTWRHGLRSLLQFKSFDTPDSVEQRIRNAFFTLVDKRLKHLHSLERTGAKILHGIFRKMTIETGGTKDGPFTDVAQDLAQINVFGGHHSLGLLCAWTLYELNRHPDVFRKVQAEIRTVNPSGEASDLSFKKLQNETPYLDAILNEISRLYPTVHATVRVVNSRFTLTTPKGKQVTMTPGMLMYISFYHLHTSEELWGPDAASFVPERFLEEKYKAKVGGHYMPFGFGPRACVGYQFVMLALKTYMVMLLRRCEVVIEDQNIPVKFGAILESSKPFGFTVKGINEREAVGA